MPYIRIKKKNLSILILFIIIVFAASITLSGCGEHKPEVLTGGLALKLINQHINESPFFGVLYSKAISINKDSFYPVLFKHGYIRFNRKLGYSSFTAKLRPFLFKQTGKTYLVLGKFFAKKPNVKFISKNLAEVSFNFTFQPGRLYKLAKNKHLAFLGLNEIIKSGRAVAVLAFKPFLEWQIVRFKPFPSKQ